jgi:histone H3/H4
MAVNYIMKSKVQQLAKDLDMRLSADAITAVDEKVKELLRQAGERAKKNNRKTIMAQDV